MTFRMTLSISALLAAGCLQVAEERAAFDERVGRASAGGVTVAVAEGLAAVTAVSADGATLWLSAPAISVEVTFPPALPTFTLVLDNVLPDATLTGADGASPGATTVAKQSRWILRPPLAGGTQRLTFAPPAVDRPAPFRFLAFADVQEAIGRVQDVYRRMNEVEGARFVVMAGDLTEEGSEGELRRFKHELATLRLPIYATLGNHELGDRPDGYHRHFGRGSFRFPFAGTQVTLLDSASATIAPSAYRWLQRWLEEGRDRLHIVGMHIAPLDPVGTRNGAFASRNEASKLLAMLADGGVDLTLYGHVHSYYAFTNAGIPAYISGGGGAIPERFDGIGRHFLVIDADPAAATLSVRVVRVD